MAALYHDGKFPPATLDRPRLIPLIGPANAAIARFEGVMQAIPNPDVLLSPLTSQEAVLSSRIEGTQATLDEVLHYEAEGEKGDENSPKIADIREVLNYRKALLEAARLLHELPLSQRLVRMVHAVLMQGVRGRGKAPGDYRRISNWIGPHGCAVEQARFIPVTADRLPAAMDGWERYVQSDAPDRLVQLAIAHAEFEAIHPFLDGNGRLGRLLIPVCLFNWGLLSRPNFYISEFLEQNCDEYYERLLAVSRDGDWTGWCEFFLKGVMSQAQTNQRRAIAILELYRLRKDWVVDLTHSQYALRALDWMFLRPIFQTSDFIQSVGIPAPTATRILRIVREAGLLIEIRPSSGSRPATLGFKELLDIADGKLPFVAHPFTTI